MDANKVLFSSEFEDEGMKRGVNSLLTKLEQLQVNVNDSKESVRKYNAELKQSQLELDVAGKKLSVYSSLSSQNKEVVDAQRAEVDKLRLAHVSLKEKLSDAGLIVQRNTRDLHNYEKELNATNREHQLLERSTEKFTNVNHLAAEGLTHIRRQVVDFGLGLASGFVGVIVGAAIPSVEKLAEKLIELATEGDEAARSQRDIADVLTEASKAAAPDIATLEVYKTKLNDLSIPAKDRIRIAKEYNAIADEGNKIDLKQIDNLTLINAQIEKQNGLIIQRAISTAALGKLTDYANTLVEAELNLRKGLKDVGLTEEQAINLLAKGEEASIKRFTDISKLRGAAFKKALKDQIADEQTQNSTKGTLFSTTAPGLSQELISLIEKSRDAKKALDDKVASLSDLITPDGLTKDPGGSGKNNTKHIENVYLQKLLELRERLAKVTASVFQDEGLIRKEFASQLDKEFADLDKLVKEKKLTAKQSIELKGIVVKINDAELDKNLDEFAKKIREANEQITDQIQTTQLEVATKRVEGLRDQFEKERFAIEEGYNATLAAIDKKRREVFEKIDESVKKGLVSDEDAVVSKLIFVNLFSSLIDQANIDKTNKQLDLTMKVFDQTIKDGQATLANDILNLTTETNEKISRLSKAYLSGTVNYERYQKRLTEILKEETDIRRAKQKQELQDELEKINALLVTVTDPTANKNLETRQRAVRNQILQLDRETDEGNVNTAETKKNKQIASLLSYVNAIGSLTNEIIGFWQKVNEVEAKQIERSIALQEKRVTAAQRIADRGNAEYLRQEEDRLNQLQIKQENAAKKQLAVNAVLTASQALVAFISAIAQGAKIGGALGAITDAAAIIALLGTGYSIVKSLQSSAPKLYRGTKSAERMPGEKPGQDTLLRWINEKEAVIPASTNEAYKPTVNAIYDKTIPPEVINNFVNSYPRTKTPTVNYQTIQESAEFKINGDGKLVAVMEKQNQQQRETIEVLKSVDHRLKHFGVSWNLDKEGFAINVLQAQDKITKSSKA